jgi:two-component system response regulator FixJ
MATERTVYVLDDDDAVLRSLERLLSSANFEPVTFDRPGAFLAAARTFKAGQGDVQTAVRAMKGGASDFLEKPYSDHALLGSIEAAFGRETQFDRDREIGDAIRRIATLSPREREVLDQLVSGRPNKLIAYHLGISVRTVEVHRARMMERLGVRQLAEAIRVGVLARLNASAGDNR